MGSDPEKYQYKLEKKRLKAEKKRAKAEQAQGKEEPQTPVVQAETLPWYKDSAWIRTIIGIASLIVALVALYFTVF